MLTLGQLRAATANASDDLVIAIAMPVPDRDGFYGSVDMLALAPDVSVGGEIMLWLVPE